VPRSARKTIVNTKIQWRMYKFTHSVIEADSEQEGVKEHADEANQQERFPASFFDEDQTDDSHDDVHGAHCNSCELSVIITQLGHFENLC